MLLGHIGQGGVRLFGVTAGGAGSKSNTYWVEERGTSEILLCTRQPSTTRNYLLQRSAVPFLRDWLPGTE